MLTDLIFLTITAYLTQISRKVHRFWKYTPKRASTIATKSHWVEANQKSVPTHPINEKITATKAAITNILDKNSLFFLKDFNSPTPFRAQVLKLILLLDREKY